MRTFGRAALLVGLLLMLPGCPPPESRPDIPRSDWSRQRLACSTDQAFVAAREAAQQWFTLDAVRPADGLITTVPIESEERGNTGRIRDAALQYPNRVRRKAVLRVSAAPDGAAVDCVVLRERLDTADHRVFQQGRSFADVPNQTPMASESPANNQPDVWTEIGRDRALERQMLDAARQRAASAAPSAPPPS
ncbi:MAG: hypothetical protein U1A27_03305 [Phycisphaerae bacterium]